MSSREHPWWKNKICYEVQFLEKGQSPESAFNKCNKKDGHKRFNSVNEVTQEKLYAELNRLAHNHVTEVIKKSWCRQGQPVSNSDELIRQVVLSGITNEETEQLNILLGEQTSNVLLKLIQNGACGQEETACLCDELSLGIKCFLERTTRAELEETLLKIQTNERPGIWKILFQKLTKEECLRLKKLLERVKDEQFSKDLLQFIHVMCTLTVKLNIEDLNCNMNLGSGFIHKSPTIHQGKCPCPKECTGKKPDGKYAKVTVVTALHVLPKEDDAENCSVQLFYDKEMAVGADAYQDDDDGYILYGMKRHSVDTGGDYCCLECVTHDAMLIERLAASTDQYWKLGDVLKDKYGEDLGLNFVVIVSHPHGMPKTITIGQLLDKKIVNEVREGQDKCKYSYDTATCPGSSGAFVYVVGRMMDGFGYWLGKPHSHSGADVGFNVSGTGEVAREND